MKPRGSRWHGRTAALLLPLLGAVACVGSGEGLDWEGRPLMPDADLATAGATDGGESADGGFGWIRANVFEPLCVKCHQGAGSPKGLELDATSARALLVGVASEEVPSLARVKPGSSADSYLFIKLVSSDSRRVGARMPLNGPVYLTETQLQAIRAWIDQGAP